MYVSDPIGDMITRIRNAHGAAKRTLACPYSKFREQVLNVLQDEGYIRGFRVEILRDSIKQFIIELKYVDSTPVITTITRKSTPGMRRYMPCGKIPKVANGLGISILSTSKGVMSDVKARALGVGGELLCTVF